jgi:fluoride exporter
MKLLWLALAGSAGTLARYGLGGLVARWNHGSFPWETLVVNMLGCLLFGVIWSLAMERNLIGPETRVILLVGFMGAFTTFSSFAFETGQLMRDGQWLLAFANMAAEMILGLAALFVGFVIGRWF